MKANKVFYQKCSNLGNYSNEVIGIELTVEEGEKAEDVLARAKDFVNIKSEASPEARRFESAKRILATPDDYTGKEVKEARALLEEKTDMPF